MSWAPPQPSPRRSGAITGESALANVTAIMYVLGGGLLLASAVHYTPGKNPRWALAALGILGVAMAATALLRGRAFTRGEATAMLGIHLVVLAMMTHTSHLVTAAFCNGIGLPVTGIYTSLLLARWAAILYYAGLAAYVAAVLGHGNPTLSTGALIIGLQGVIATEIVRLLFARMQRLAQADPLTRVLNRHGLESAGHAVLSRARQRGTPVSVVLIDLDDLRAINNSHGHRAGDDLLVAASRQWLEALSGSEAVGRVGGDEFVLILPGTDEEHARRRITELAAAATVRWTAGIAQLQGEESLTDLIERADQDMYVRKSRRSTPWTGSEPDERKPA